MARTLPDRFGPTCVERQARTNVARAFVTALIGTVQAFFNPRQAPLHDLSFHPFAGDGVRRTGEYEGKLAEQRDGHAMPAPELRTAPLPVTATVRRNVAGAKSADSLAPGETVRLQPALPEHAPAQRTSFAPVTGVAVSARGWPEFQVVVQFDEHWRPGTSAETEPGPETLRASCA
jgi:hypothetical protein